MSLVDKTKIKIESATVRILTPERGPGQGVLVGVGDESYILTAAHCVTWDTLGGMAMGDIHLEKIETKTGQEFRLQVLAVEPVQDVAVLGFPEPPELSKDADSFASFIDGVSRLEILTGKPAGQKIANVVGETKTVAFPVWILSHQGNWIEGNVQQFITEPSDLLNFAKYWIETSEVIEGGTSGGPIVDQKGRLISVVSQSEMRSDGEGGDTPLVSQCFRLSLALPVWVMNE